MEEKRIVIQSSGYCGVGDGVGMFSSPAFSAWYGLWSFLIRPMDVSGKRHTSCQQLELFFRPERDTLNLKLSTDCKQAELQRVSQPAALKKRSWLVQPQQQQETLAGRRIRAMNSHVTWRGSSCQGIRGKVESWGRL